MNTSRRLKSCARWESLVLKNKPLLAIIPARGGSKGLPGKNIRLINGQPLISLTVKSALACDYVDRVMVTTDDEEIAYAAREAGAEIPFMRPAELASDTALASDVILHCLNYFAEQGEAYEYFVYLQPTSPLRSKEDLDSGLNFFEEKDASCVVSVCETEHHPWYSNQLPEDGNMKDFIRPEVQNTNRQELPAFYRLNGSMYICQTGYYRTQGGFMGPETYAFRMPTERSLDIDTLTDFKMAELLLSEK